jgi:hypothetical protein
MQLPKLSVTLTASLLLFGCTSQPPKPQPSPTPSASTPTPALNSTNLKAAVKELQMIQTKIKSGINEAGYSVVIAKTLPLVQHASGDAKAVAAVKSAFQGHQLALKFWQCDRVSGYQELHQCRGNVLAAIFAKYPDIQVQVKAAVKSKDFSTISTKLDKDEILKKIWNKTSADLEVARQAIAVDTSQKSSN